MGRYIPRQLDDDPNEGRWTRWFVVAMLVAGIVALLCVDTAFMPECMFVNVPLGVC